MVKGSGANPSDRVACATVGHPDPGRADILEHLGCCLTRLPGRRLAKAKQNASKARLWSLSDEALVAEIC